jgi:cellulose synthase/poly-beta-1,6-N-acetylglucosamine synthase-like glycosyltransferase
MPVYAMQVPPMHDMSLTTLMLITTVLSSAALVIYHHLGYPLILRWWHKQHPITPLTAYQRHYTCTSVDDALPTITIIVPAYNEQQWIADKIRNLATLDYPSHRLQIMIACDGCTDNTVAIAMKTSKEAECQHLRLEIINSPQNCGKVAVINQAMTNLTSELIALSDVSALISIDALLIAAERFKDPAIGVLNGHYRLLSPGSTGEAAYWHYQSKLKASEAALGSTLGAHGAFYLFRRTLFEPLAADTINDDFILPMRIVAAGYRADYEGSINALELEQADNNQDHQRRRRIAAGNFQQLLRLKQLLLPRYGGIAFAFISGKGLRVLMPFLMIATLICSLLLAFDYGFFLLLAIVQVLAYFLAAWEMLYKPTNSHKVSQILAYIVGGHMAGFIGTLNYILRKHPYKHINHRE